VATQVATASHHAAASEQQEDGARPASNRHVGGSVSSAAAQLAGLTCNSELNSLDGARIRGEQFDADGTAQSSPQGQVVLNGVGLAAVAEVARGAHSDAALPLDFRIVSEPVGIQPASALYGVPYDLVDQSAGSALAELMQLTQ